MAGRFPFSGLPRGWYVAATSDELARRSVVARRYFGRDLVLFRTESGVARMADAHCPHLGAHLGHGGTVEGETLRCPFHGFRFDGDGACVATPSGGRLPARAQLRTWPLREQSGLVLAWFDAEDKPPDWEVPALATEGWTRLGWKTYDVNTHPQETTENSVDFGHFTQVHNFLSARMTRAVATDGPLLRSGYAIERSLDMIGLPKRGVRAQFEVSVWGLGYSLVELQLPRFGLRFRLFVLPIPVDEEHIELRLACAGERRMGPLGVVFRSILLKAFSFEVEEDIPIWNRKVYREAPALSPEDEPVAVYRRWARQFYPPPREDGDGSAPRSTLAP
jgi:nitrite reductase/ring-hydroxylating ferredoxin subunit